MVSLRVALLCAVLPILVHAASVAASIDPSDEGGQASRPPPTDASNDASRDETDPPMTHGPPISTPSASSQVLWFVPSDHDLSTTCLTLLNATTTEQTVTLEGFALDGAPSGTWNIPVPAGSGLHACSDSLAASPPPSWANTFIANFTDFVAYVRATLPAGVHIDGFIANTGTGTYDARASTNTIELRFNPDVAVTTVVDFAPQDNDANATCLNLVNTSAVAATVPIRGYNDTGPSGSWNIDIPAGALVRVCSDSLAANPPPSWENTVIVNFTDFVYRAEAVLPPHVKIDGFVVWNPGTGTVDPRTLSSNFLNLRFETTPDQIFADGFEV